MLLSVARGLGEASGTSQPQGGLLYNKRVPSAERVLVCARRYLPSKCSALLLPVGGADSHAQKRV